MVLSRRMTVKRPVKAGSATRSAAARARVTSLLFTALIAALYFFGARLGWYLSPRPELPLIWPPHAVLFAALLLAPLGFWKTLLAPVAIAHLLAAQGSSAAPALVAADFCGTLLAALIGASALRYALGGAPRFDRLRDTACFVLYGVLLAPALAALLVTALSWPLAKVRPDWMWSWRTLFFAHALALAALAPALIAGAQAFYAWCTRARNSEPAFDRRFAARAGEAAILTLAVAALGLLIFGAANTGATAMPLLWCVAWPLLLWVALRLSSGCVALALFLLTALALWSVRSGAGPFALGSAGASVFAMQTTLLALTLPALLLGAVMRERREAQVQAGDREKVLNLILHAARMSTWVWDLEPQKITVKTTAATVLQGGASTGRAFSHCMDRVHQDDRRALEQTLAAAVERGAPYAVEFRLCEADGGVRWMSSRGLPQLDARGKPWRIVGTTADISECKRHGQQLQELRQELAHLSRVAMLGELSGAITHELNQPLTTVLSNAQAAQQLLAREPADLEEIRAILADIVAENKRAGEIIRRLRTLLKKGEIQLQEVDVNELVLEVIGLEHSDLIARNIFVGTQLAALLPRVRADRVQMQQVLLNLMINASDAMAGNAVGDRLIKIGTHAEGDLVQVVVSDRGPGLPGDPERIFEAFFTTKPQGLGLGLTICRSIIGAHGGELRAANGEQGAVFTIVLPGVHLGETTA